MDLSRVLFIATANQLATVHPALLDRMEMIALVGYTEEEKLTSPAVPRARQVKEHGLTAEVLDLEDAAIRRIIAEYTREAGVRTLERQIGTWRARLRHAWQPRCRQLRAGRGRAADDVCAPAAPLSEPEHGAAPVTPVSLP